MKIFLINLIFILFNIKANSKKEPDIFDYAKNLRFCGVDLFSQKPKILPNPISKKNRTRALSTTNYKPIRIFVETTHFEYQGQQNSSLSNQVPIIKSSLDKSVEAIKGLIQVKDTGDETNYFKDVIHGFFREHNIQSWSPIFDNGADIKSDFLIIVKFDTEYNFPKGVLASAYPLYLEPDTKRPLISLLTITTDPQYFNMRRVNEYFSEVILHELTHALGFLNSMYDYFPGGRENTVNNQEIIRGVQRSIIKTPKVVELAKKYFNCERIKGVEVEDQGGEGSMLSHWEQRVLLGDYMGAVIYQEEMVISEFTLALLEDSGFYKANYYTGGLMRYGKNKGCDFIEKNCLDSQYITQFGNEFFDRNESRTPSCTSGRQSRAYAILNPYPGIMDNRYSNNFFYDPTSHFYYSGAMYTTDYCFTYGQDISEANNGYFTGNCKYGEGGFYGYYIYYYNSYTGQYESGYANKDLPSYLGEIYSDTSFCIMSSLSPTGKDPLYSSVLHPMCYQIYCSSLSLTIKINDDYIVCPREGGNIEVKGYDGYVNCPDYNLMCTGTVMCNDMFDCIEKKSSVKESTYKYDYVPKTTQKYSRIGLIPHTVAYELSDDGFCPKNCAQCDAKKECKVSKKSDDDNDDSNFFVWIFVSIAILLVIIAIGVAIFLIYKKKNMTTSGMSSNNIEKY